MADAPNQKRRRGRPKREDKGDPKRSRVTITLPESELNLFKDWAQQEGVELASLVARICVKALKKAIADREFIPSSPKEIEKSDRSLLEKFLRVTADDWAEDGYSVKEIIQSYTYSETLSEAEIDRLEEIRNSMLQQKQGD